MLKGKLKLPEKARLVLPDRIGNLVVGFDEKDEENAGSDSGIDFGEELETLLPYELGSDRESDGETGKLPIEEEKVADDSKCRVRPRLEKEVVVSVSEAIAADEKRSDLQHELSQDEINLERLQRIASTGLPDGGGLRATTWKLLLGYLPPSRDLWEKELIENRLKYAKLKEEFLLSPSQIKSRMDETLNSSYKLVESNTDGLLQRHEISQEDHPLSLGKASAWNQFFQHTEIIDQIDRDLQRTHPDMKFFSGESSISRKNRESMKNVLLLFAKVNPAISYVQGMNEVLAPIYYLFSTDPDEHNAANVEADSFSCFVRLLGDLVDHFCEQLDNSSVGILSTLSRLSELLKENDEELWRHLELTNKIELSYLRTEETSHLSLMEQIKAQYYGFRWITLLLTQEFNFYSIMRIWDSLLSNPFGVQDMLLRICCAMLLCMKSRLMRGDFVSNLKLLQHYPDINIEHLLDVARDISPDTSSYRISLYGRTFIVVFSQPKLRREE